MISPLQASLGSQHFNYNKDQRPTAVAQQIFLFPLEKSQRCSLVVVVVVLSEKAVSSSEV